MPTHLKDRAAYDWAVETTIYLDKDAREKAMARNFTKLWRKH